MPAEARYWAAIPAAGIGTRMGTDVPKQYLQVRGRSVLVHCLERFLGHVAIAGVVVALAEADTWWKALDAALRARVQTVIGGQERCHSVLNCLRALRGRAAEEDWVLVHDAARPCLSRGDLDALMDQAGVHDVGGILAVPVRDTMKQAGTDGGIDATVDRRNLWHALTPQMFRVGPLERALAAAIRDGIAVTDEAQAMELQGCRPLLVRGRADNIKITHPDDLALAEFHLSRQEATR